MPTLFESFVTTELPKRPTLLLSADSGVAYDGDPNDGAAPAIIDASPIGTLYLRASTGALYQKQTASAGSWTTVVAPVGSATIRTVNVSAGTQPGIATVDSQILGETLRIVGATALATLTTGANTGTAGAATTPTSVAKPTAAADWTADDLVGHWWLWTGGAGASSDGSPIFREIWANTTTTLSIDSVPGIDDTTTFQIVDLTSQIDWVSSGNKVAIDVRGVYGGVEIFGLDFSTAHALDSLIHAYDCFSPLKISGCKIAINTANPAILVERCQKPIIEHIMLSNSADISVVESFNVQVNGVTGDGGGVVSITDSHVAKATKIRSDAAPSRVLEMVNIHKAEAEVDANGGAATPIYLESCHTFSPIGTLITGSGNVGTGCFGMEIQGTGSYNLVGVDIVGDDGDLNFLGDATAWSLLSNPSYGIVSKWGSSAYGVAGYSKTLLRGNLGMEGALDVGGRLLTFGYFNLAANTTTIPLLAGYTLDMERSRVHHVSDGLYYPTGTEAPRAVCVVSCDAAGAKIMLPDGAAIAGILCIIINLGAFAGDIIAPDTAYGANGPTGSITGSITTVNAGGISTFVSLNTNGGHDFAGAFQS